MTLKNNDFSDIAYNRKSIRVYDETVKFLVKKCWK